MVQTKIITRYDDEELERELDELLEVKDGNTSSNKTKGRV